VDQISLPYRIGLVALVLVGGLWFAVLRPKPASQTPQVTTAPGVTGLAKDVAKAKGAVDASNKGAAATDAAANAVGGSGTTTAPSAGTAPSTGTTTTTPGQTAKPAKPAAPGLAADAVAGDPSRSVLSAIDAGKVAVVLFWNRKASDDRATRQALRKVDLHHGKVVTRAIPIGQVGKYEAITRSAQVLESPTVLVIGAGGKARSIIGYTQANEINDLVGVVGGKGYASTKAFHLTGFAKVADNACRDFAFNFQQATDFPTSRTALVSYFSTGATEMGKVGARLKATPATGVTDKALKTSLLTFADSDVALARAAGKDLKGGGNAAQVIHTFLSSELAAKKPSAALAKKARVRGCQ
jgi:hypothetical protein